MSLENTLKKAEEKENKIQTIIPFTLNREGNIKANSLRNIGLILERDALLKGTFAYNEFAYAEEVKKDIPALHIKKGYIEDSYVAGILRYIEDKYEVLFAEKLLYMAISNESHKNAYNPVKTYLLEAAECWDKKIRVDELLPTFLGVEHSEITTLQTKLFFVGAVAKVFEPTIKFDYVLDLVGGQGAGKTTFLKRMSNNLYTDQFVDFKDKDGFINMQKAWIVNDDEMTATKNSDFETLKKFISAEEMEYRPPYGRTAVRRPKNFVIARTSNEITYLRDKTGERRFLPNFVSKEKQLKSPLKDLTKEVVKQLWGEFVNYYQNGFSFWLDDAEGEKLIRHREKFMYVDEVESQIEECLQTWPGDFISSSQIAKELGEDNLVKNKTLSTKIKYIMDNHKEWTAASKKIAGVSKRGYKKIN